MTNLYTDAMEMLHDRSLPSIELLQTSFPDKKHLMINISTLFDPRYMFLIGAPILFALNQNVGHRTIVALTLTEWINQILKWLLAGDRPYWYVHERAHEIANRSLTTSGSNVIPLQVLPVTHLEQFPVTCELGAGSPSGHSMVSATVFYIIIEAYLRGELGLDSQLLKRWVAKITWTLYSIALVAVGLSRVYLACHFPHQCLGGALCGLLVARFVSRRVPMENLKKHHFAMATGVMFASALSVYSSLIALGYDPLWSVNKGTRWCIKKEYIHLDTTPFFSMMRYLGFALGPGLAYTYRVQEKDKSSTLKSLARGLNKKQVSAASTLLGALLSILFGQVLMSLPMPKSNLMLFYMISFLNYTLFSWAIAAPIPQLAKRLLGMNASKLRQN